MKRLSRILALLLALVLLAGCASQGQPPVSGNATDISGESAGKSGSSVDISGESAGKSGSSVDISEEMSDITGESDDTSEGVSDVQENPDGDGEAVEESAELEENSEDAESSEDEGADTESPELQEGEWLAEDGVYSSKEEVALYLHLYGHLPSNYITKKEAEKLGWPGGSLDPYAPGMCIGGSRFGNYEGLLPEKDGRVYTECDIDTLGADKRGAKRIVFSNDGLIYYTEDHYQSFELLYGDE